MASNMSAAAVGKRIQAARKAARLSVPQLADKVGVHRSHVWRVEDGQTTPPLDQLAVYARALGVSLPSLLFPRAVVRRVQSSQRIPKTTDQ